VPTGAPFPAIDYRPPKEDSRKSTWRGPGGHIKGIELGSGTGQQMTGDEYYQAQDDFKRNPVQVGEATQIKGSEMFEESLINQIIIEELAAILEKKKSPAWQRKAGKNKEGGLNKKGRESYEKENPGSDLKAPTKKKGNKRRKSFCARMKGMKKKNTSAKTARDPDSRINKSLRKWDC
jgi:hypothetical protein